MGEHPCSQWRTKARADQAGHFAPPCPSLSAFALSALPLALRRRWPAAGRPGAGPVFESYKFLDAVRKKTATRSTRRFRSRQPDRQHPDVSTGETALHIVTRGATCCGCSSWWARANVNIAQQQGRDPLVIAANLGFLEGVDFLISVGARVDDPNNTGETPLITAVHVHNIALVRSLLKAGANPDRPDNSGRSARDYAALDKHRDVRRA
jgi:hypothetical protein